MRQPKQFPHAGQDYLIGRLDAFQQFHVGRRIAPLLAKFADSFKTGTFDPTPLAEGLRDLSQADAEYVLRTCLGAVSRKQVVNGTEVWSPLQVRGGNQLMFDDLEGGDLLALSVEVITENLGGFFPTAAPPSASPTQG